VITLYPAKKKIIESASISRILEPLLWYTALVTWKEKLPAGVQEIP
jgi:hypothetical protein